MEIREVQQELIAAVKEFLANRPGFGAPGEWEGLFNYPWKLESYPYGYAILDGNKIVAFIGTIFSQRMVDGKKNVCCNMTSWFVEEEYRPRMLGRLILNPILNMEGLLITSLSPSDLSRGLCERLGFKYLEHEQVAIPVIPGTASLAGNNGKWPLILFEAAGIERHLNDDHRKIFQDHAKLACKHFLIEEEDGEYCYGLATTTPLSKFRMLKGHWLNLCYLSNAAVFARNFHYFKKRLWKVGRFLFLRYDARLLQGELSRMAVRKTKARQFRSKEQLSWTVDNLYSELVTFNKY